MISMPDIIIRLNSNQCKDRQAYRAEVHPFTEDWPAGQKVVQPAQAAREENADEPAALQAQRRKAEAVDVKQEF